jgi:hypothetical protein
MQFGADLAESFVPVEGLVGFSVLLTQHLNMLHFLVVFFCGGKKHEEPGFEYVIRLGCFGKEFLSSRTKFLRHGADFYAGRLLKSIGFTGFLHGHNKNLRTGKNGGRVLKPQTYIPGQAR